MDDADPAGSVGDASDGAHAGSQAFAGSAGMPARGVGTEGSAWWWQGRWG